MLIAACRAIEPEVGPEDREGVVGWAEHQQEPGEQAVKTTTVLTIDLPGDLGDRLRRALRQRPGRMLRDITIEALEEWLERQPTESDSAPDK